MRNNVDKLISILLVDDDYTKISNIISAIKEVFTDTLKIDQAINVQEALEFLKLNNYDLLITDFLLPLREGEALNENGGITLLKNIIRKPFKPPIYAVGLTQYDELKQSYNGVWKVWKYDSAALEWKLKLRDLIRHISLVTERFVREKKETIFLEGISDQIVLSKTFNYFYPELTDFVSLYALKSGGGASWVERQIIVWAKSLTIKNITQKYLKSVGVLDCDLAGDTAIKNIESHIVKNSAEDKTFSICQLKSNYSTTLQSLKKKGILIDICIEELYGEDHWRHAHENKMLEPRGINNILINKELLNIDNLSYDILITNGLSKLEAIMTLFKVKDECKIQLSQYEANVDSFIFLSYLLKDVLKKLKLTN